MTVIQSVWDTQLAEMEQVKKEDNGKTSRPVRSRRYTRRSLVAGQKPQKRLFTPEIKRYLKDWLVRRRENPYPNREEKKHLSQDTGLTYIQICNWFANWRRKLKNANADRDRNPHTWGHLIRTYNYRAEGNVEQFSICSDDSIWSEPEHSHNQSSPSLAGLSISDQRESIDSDTSSSKEKYENNNSYSTTKTEQSNITSPMLLSKWLESAARFQPSEMNYSWWADGNRRKAEHKVAKLGVNISRHDRDEVEAAVALTALASAASRLTAP